jgi:hypothetical protein
MVIKQCKDVGLFTEFGKFSTEKCLLLLIYILRYVAKCSSCPEQLLFVTPEAFCLEYRVVLWAVLITDLNSPLKM